MGASMKILIMGLPGAGKTYLSERLQKHLQCAWFNADEVRRMSGDWDFSSEGRVRQARRMRNLANFEKSEGNTVICDFVCPTQLTRYIFEPDFTIWLNTISLSVYADTNNLFEPPGYADIVIEKFLTDEEIVHVVNKIAGVHA
jgi:adenylylsulfate kinase